MNLEPVSARAGGEGDVLWFGDSRLVVRLDSERSAGKLAWIECFSPRGSSSPLHRGDHDQVYVVREGELALFSEGTWHLASAGASLHFPSGMEFAFRVLSPTATYDVLAMPAGLERFFRSVSEPARGTGLPGPGRSEPDQAALISAAAGAGIEVVGPTPPLQPGSPYAAAVRPDVSSPPRPST